MIFWHYSIEGKYFFEKIKKLDFFEFCDILLNGGETMTKGSKNFQWKGGIATYPNHYELKKNRLIKLKETKGLCEICNKSAKYVHHLDETKTNHSCENLVVVCSKCHIKFFHTDRLEGFRHISKYIRLYGMTLEKIAEKLGGSNTHWYLMHKNNPDKMKEIITEYLNTHKTTKNKT
jgi:hypothetical protein